MEGEERRKTRKLHRSKMLEKIADVAKSIEEAIHVDQVVSALHSVAVLVFPVDSSLVLGSIDQLCGEQERSSAEERSEQWEALYRGGVTFAALARVLLYDDATKWLPSFPASARKHVYDVFFVSGLPSEVIQSLVPCLRRSGNGGADVDAVSSNAERLLVCWLLENNGVLNMAREFDAMFYADGFTHQQLKPLVSRASQLVTSIPDKVQSKAPKALSSHLYFKKVTAQLLSGAEEFEMKMNEKASTSSIINSGGGLLFVGEVFSRICRRGSADILVSELVSHIRKHIGSYLCSNPQSKVAIPLKSMPGSLFWSVIIDAVADPYAVERMSEQLLHHLAKEHTPDEEAYWILWLLFHQSLERNPSVKSIFVDKFLMWKVFQLNCLRWILQVSVFMCPPNDGGQTNGVRSSSVLDTLQHLVEIWSKPEFVQSSPIEQQAYVTAAVGLCMEKVTKEELDSRESLLHSFLPGVSCRLASPNDLIRKMASNVALVFSKIIDPSNLLYLDESCKDEPIDWDFGSTLRKDYVSVKDSNHSVSVGKRNKQAGLESSETKLMEIDEYSDPATLKDGLVSEESDDEKTSNNWDASSESAMLPYDLADDDTDLKNNFSQLVDVVKALRKPDDPDGVERALDVAEKIIRACPDELRHVAGDLARTLVQARCSDLTIEGEEETAEEKRQGALIALLVTVPFESLEAVNNLLYSPNLDASQRILILDVMSNAAQELSIAQVVKPKPQKPRELVSVTSETQPWFLPRSVGPHGAGPWREIPDSESPLNWSYKYERELPLKSSHLKKGKTRRWSQKSKHLPDNCADITQNKFPVYAAAFMLPAMRGFDKKRHGVDLLGKDFIILGKLIHTLGICIKCAAMHPEASALAPALLDMLSSREVCHHAEAHVRKSVLFACSCILIALHPSHVASALAEGNLELSRGLDWIRSYAIQAVESDIDKECYAIAMACLQLHSEMALQTSRALETVETSSRTNILGLPPSNLTKESIIIPFSNIKY
uniref:Telomere length regulation protein conserved domain-containing protein n=1 Tax=Kalanchoe fedtschenkoi TaxID=63787 RepID=A0A7N0RJV4_KALFE